MGRFLGSIGGWIGALAALASLPGCGNLPGQSGPLLFSVPLSIDGREVGPAIVDTGGDFEIMLRESFGLGLVGDVEVLAFGGRERVEVTEGFTYKAGSVHAYSGGAIVGVSSCECNGIGYQFFRRIGVVLGLDYRKRALTFYGSVPESGVIVPYVTPPEPFATFTTAFVDVEVRGQDAAPRQVVALLDTGASTSVFKRSVLPGANPMQARREIEIEHSLLGAVRASVGLHNNEDLPDLIIGNDIMGVWGDRWYFEFTDFGGSVTVVPAEPFRGSQNDFDGALAKAGPLGGKRFPSVPGQPTP